MKTPDFDLARSPLTGVNLIEAGAGTGKTYTLAGLYLRLILEKQISVEKILVVTFTEAATQELKERIRKRLKSTLYDFEQGISSDALTAHLLAQSDDPARDRQLLDTAIRSFDMAAVHTIHGFCQRMLVENAFESGALFDTELVTDIDELFQTVGRDFYRIHVYPETSMFLTWLHHKNVGPETFDAFVRQVLKPGLRLIPPVSPMDPFVVEQRLARVFDDLIQAWGRDRDGLFAAMSSGTGLNKTSYKPASIPHWFERMDRYAVRDGDPLKPPSCLEKFRRSTLEKKVNKGHQPPDFPLLDRVDDLAVALEDLGSVYENNLLCLKSRARDYMKEELVRRKEIQGIMSFDDLLVRLHQALTGPLGPRLEGRIQSKYTAALIDEFQDTDPIQYTIFSRVFAGHGTVLFMIGDPKQAIYAFRGADIFAYMQAARDAQSGYALGFNYRSDEKLVTAVNAIFSAVTNPFVFEEISFDPARAAVDQSFSRLTVPGEEDAPFHVWLFDSKNNPKALTKGEAGQTVTAAVASEIKRLLVLGREGGAHMGDRPLRESDMAILVRTNSEARTMKRVMSTHGIPAVIYDTGNVFDSNDAVELHRVMAAMAMPGREDLVKAALSTTLVGLAGADIVGFEHDPGALEPWMDRFRDYHDQWRRHGFIDVFNTLVKDRDVRARLMGYDQGERRNTNLSHLAQLLHQASLEDATTSEGLLAWLWERMQDDSGQEEHQLRLERDDDAVRIVTVHKSKGMEYPIVFCPYVWNGIRKQKQDLVLFHDPADKVLVGDVGSPDFDAHKRLSEKEALAEETRLLYVALTRAKNRCYMAWGRISGAETSAVAHLVTGGILPKTDEELWSCFEELERKSRGTLFIRNVPEKPVRKLDLDTAGTTPLDVRSFRGTIENDFRITSFSSLTARKVRQGEEADRDADRGRVQDGVSGETPEGKNIFTFPRGAAAGTFLHDIFEHAGFTDDDQSLNRLVAAKLAAYRHDADWAPCIVSMVRQVLETPLAPDEPAFTLSSVSSGSRLSELEFYFPLNRIDAHSLTGVFNRHGVSGFELSGRDGTHSLDFSSVKGYLKGFMDLVFSRKEQDRERFYIVDWKSNHLGYSSGDYAPDALSRVMDEERYRLQYHLYVLALHRYLTVKMGPSYRYEEHFGGVYYLFIRGMAEKESGKNGVFFDLPAWELISDLSDLLWGS